MAQTNNGKRRSSREVAEDRLATLRARLETEQLKAALAYYTAADKGRKNRDWRAPLVSADQAIIPDVTTLIARSRHTIANTWIGKAASRSQKRNVVGRGVMVVPTAKDREGKDLPALNRRAADLWMRWASSKNACDLERRRSYWQIQRTIVGEEFAAGEAFVVWSYIANPVNVGLRLQMFEPEQLDTTIQTYGGNEVRGGIEVDEFGAAVAYHFYKRNPNDYLGRTALQSHRVPAERVRHYFDPDRVLQARGEPRMAPVLNDVRDFSSFKDATLWRARMEACIGLVIKKNGPAGVSGIPGIGPRAAGDSGQTASGMRTFDIVPGMVAELQQSEDVEPFTPSSPGNQYDPFTRVTLRGIGAGVGQSYGALTRENNANYSAARQDMLEDEREIQPQQDALIDTEILPDYELFFRFAAIEGKFDDIDEFDMDEFLAEPERFVDAEYIVPRRPWIDPKNEFDAYEKGIKLRIISRGEIVAMSGGRLKNLLEQIDTERKDAAAVGVTFPEDVETETQLAAAAADKAAAIADKAAAEVDTTTADATKRQAEQPPAGDAAEPVGGETRADPPATGDAGIATDLTLNGAQITAAIDVMTRIRSGDLSEFAAVDLLVPVGIERTIASRMVKDAKKLPPPEKTAPAPATGSAPLRNPLDVIDAAPKYRAATAVETSCATCRFLIGDKCTAYEFIPAAGKVCDAWEATPPTTPSSGRKTTDFPRQEGEPPIDSPGGFASDAPRE